MTFNSTVLILPGLGNSGPEHWQSIWEKEFPAFKRVEQQNWDTPDCETWINYLNSCIPENSKDVLLVGHSLACQEIVFWAKKFNRKVKGALLVAPSDTEAASYPEGTTGFSPVPLTTLDFPSIVVSSMDDFYVSAERAALFAEAWGSRLIPIGNAGHINAGSGFGNWDEGLALLKELDR